MTHGDWMRSLAEHFRYMRMRYPTDHLAVVFDIDRLAAFEVRRTTSGGSSRAEMMERVVIGTVVFDAVISALRRLAQERHSAARLGSRIE